MWNIRSHARRFPVHTGTLTPSIAHPNRFLNHLKRFSAGFLTFRGGKIKKCTVSGDKTNDFECAPGSWLTLSVKPYRACQLSQRESPWHDGKVSGQTAKLAGALAPTWGSCRAAMTERVHAVRNSPSHLALLDASPLGDGALDMAGKLPDKLQSFQHARGSLSEGAGKTVRF